MISHVTVIFKLVAVDLLGSIFWFPIWWYTTGLQKVIQVLTQTIRYRIHSYALRIWIKNFFVPMYGQYDWTSRLISIFMRTVVFVWRLIQLSCEAGLYIVGVIVWVISPLFFLGMLGASIFQNFAL